MLICILNNNSGYEAPVSTALYRSFFIKVAFFLLADVDGGPVSAKTKEINWSKSSADRIWGDQKPPVTRYEELFSDRRTFIFGWII